MSQEWTGLAAAVLLGGLLILAVVWGVRRWRNKTERRLARRLRRHSWDFARDVVIPDGLDGYVHLDRVLIRPQGLLLLDIKRVNGSVFGAEKMDEWVVMDSGRRFGFRNPLGSLQERMTALRAFAPQMEVDGYVLVLGNVEFPKGRPARTLAVEDLEEHLEAVEGQLPDGWKANWNAIRGRSQAA